LYATTKGFFSRAYVAFRIPKTSVRPLKKPCRPSSLDPVRDSPLYTFSWRFYMFKKVAMLLTLAFSLAVAASAMSPSQQYPLPPPDGGGGNIVLQ
jgi:hypothetical protein